MTKEIASILKRRLIGLPFFNVFAGIAQPVTDTKYAQEETGERKISKKMPVSYDLVGGKSLYLGMERQLVPNENKKGIVYFEDFGTTNDASGSTRSLNFISNIRLVGWMNKTKFDAAKYADVTGICIDQVLKRLCLGGAINEDGIQRLFVTATSIPIQDAAIFSRYNYNEDELMYLRPPFEYFAIDLRCKYSVGRVRCTGHQYVAGYMPAPVIALIKDDPDPTILQTLLNGDKVRKEYAPGNKLKLLDAGGQPYMKGKYPLSSFVVDNIPFQNEPFDTQTGEFDHSAWGGFSSSNNPGVVTFDVNVPLK